ncbi:hypothetical protein GCM10023311_11290 [Flaviramulus aquimarinus]|uniref:DUF4296 domain-containing protein n=1 Tax=Flaviramulus aquimarinus TaxID=1170456 RepID=A0ABP9EWG3_9FLAO
MIIKHLIICLGFMVMLSACNGAKGPKKPKNLISKEKMVDILIDSKLIASASSANKKIMRDSGVDLNTYVFTKHNIDSLQFALSNNYYAFHIKKYQEIYEKVGDSLEALKVKFKDLEAKEWKEQTKREEDSLKLLSTETKKDSIVLIEIEDSLKGVLKKKSKQKNSLIKPVSDKDFQ